MNLKEKVAKVRETMLENALKEFRSPENVQVFNEKLKYSDTIYYRTRTCWSGSSHNDCLFDKNIISKQLCEKLHLKNISFQDNVASLTFPPRDVPLHKLPPELTQEMIDEDIDAICGDFYSEDDDDDDDDDNDKGVEQRRSNLRELFIKLTNNKTSTPIVSMELHLEALFKPVLDTVWKERYATRLCERFGVDRVELELNCGGLGKNYVCHKLTLECF
jgi:hypothetical protein